VRSDTFTTVVSSTSMKVANITATATVQGFTARGAAVSEVEVTSVFLCCRAGIEVCEEQKRPQKLTEFTDKKGTEASSSAARRSRARGVCDARR
jgi:hypothetical protein